jgi:Mn2+/Fe2+ NRAMP family transporter
MLMLANDRQLMGQWANRAANNTIGVFVVAFVALCGTAYAVDSFLLSIHVLG